MTYSVLWRDGGFLQWNFEVALVQAVLVKCIASAFRQMSLTFSNKFVSVLTYTATILCAIMKLPFSIVYDCTECCSYLTDQKVDYCTGYLISSVFVSGSTLKFDRAPFFDFTDGEYILMFIVKKKRKHKNTHVFR